MPALTRAQLEHILVERVGGARSPMALAGMSQTYDPAQPNQDLADPIATAMANLGVYPPDRTNPTDADLVVFGPAAQGRLIDQAEIRTAETALRRIASRPQSIEWEDYKVSYATVITSLRDTIRELWSLYQARYSASGSPAIGRMRPEVAAQINTVGYYPVGMGGPGGPWVGPYPPGPERPWCSW